jgi:hypothetical protein
MVSANFPTNNFLLIIARIVESLLRKKASYYAYYTFERKTDSNEKKR